MYNGPLRGVITIIAAESRNPQERPALELVECVPNFSEGRDQEVIEAIAGEIAQTPGVELLDVDPGRSTHRTVVTFVGPPGPVEEAAFRAIGQAAERIDMRIHRGAHPRMGATDVCPFVPLTGTTMEDCVAGARRLGRRVGRTLGIPVYLYGEAATRPERRRLPALRAGEYEGLPAKLRDPAWAPDFGPARFLPRSGVTAIGARRLLLAWNVNLDTPDARIARRIAARLRESGGLVRAAGGEVRRVPGRFRHLQGSGWSIEEYGRAQVTFNVTDTEAIGLHELFAACREEAARLGVRVTGSEVVGLVPLAMLLAAGDEALARGGAPEGERVAAAVAALGLDELRPFVPERKVLEYRLRAALGQASL